MSETLMPQDRQSQETGGTQPDFFANHCGTLVVKQFANTEPSHISTAGAVAKCDEASEGPERDGHKPLMRNRMSDLLTPIGITAPATISLEVTDYLAARDKAMAQVEKNAGELFAASARRFVVRYLLSHGASSGEDITDACKSAGIVPHDDRAFGPVYHALAKKSVIEKAGYCERRKGNGTAGGIMWRLAT